ncbi:MAG: MarR family transcriptional regulator [Deltaproteobacteria bacterium]|nr:MAG: MarR family transcriptional regulator [Deltaproteobacteria bacterium]
MENDAKKLKDELRDCSVFLLGKAYQRAHGEFKKLLEPFGLTNLQHLVVEAILHEPGLTAGELGRVLILDKATLSGVIQRLEESGWLEKRTDGGDGRVQRLYPLGKSHEIAEEMAKSRKSFDKSFLKGLSPEERSILKRLLKELVW